MFQKRNTITLIALLSILLISEGKASEIIARMSDPEIKHMLGFGWSRSQSYLERNCRWITHLEADLWFELDEQKNVDRHLTVTAAPRYLAYRRQKIGVFLNGNYITEWLFPDSHEFNVFNCELLAKHCKPGKNRLILRMAFRRRQDPDRRELAIAVEEIRITPVIEK